MKWNELNYEQAKGLDYKIQMACSIIAQAFDVSRRPALAYSGGKDSHVLGDMIRRFFPEKFARLAVIFGNTGMEFPESAQFARQTGAEWGCEFYEAKPGKTTEPGYKYAGQRRILDRLIAEEKISEILKPDGKLKTTDALERMCPADLREELERERLVWPVGTMMSYWWCADQYGWPLLGKSWSLLDARRINIDTFFKFSKSVSNKKKLLDYYSILRHVKISQHCCQTLKKDPSGLVQLRLGVDLIFKGLMASESRSRAKNFLRRGYLFEGAKKDYLHGSQFFHCQPLAIWTDADIWTYIRRFSVPYAPLYDITYMMEDGHRENIKRNGCLGCATDFGYKNNHMFSLRQTHRPAWRTIMRAGMGQEIRNLQRAMKAGQMTIFDTVDTDDLIDMQPCIFDDMDGLGGMTAPGGIVYDPEIDPG
jgi:3'-phosphoadenosine 5'-phosphosulfate sulfotransferase (PAPS reductase)/FAD synthetase